MLFNYLDDFCITYLDDIIIYSNNKLEYKEHVCKVLLQLYKVRLQADIKKLEFNVKQTKYIGYIISTNSIKSDPKKT